MLLNMEYSPVEEKDSDMILVKAFDKTLVFLACLLFIFMLLVAFAEQREAVATRPLLAKIVKVIDGDTVKIETNIRLAEIDCPEKKQEGGIPATEYLRQMVEGKRLAIGLDGRGRYGRFIGTLFSREGGSVNEELVGEGYCWVYPGAKNKGMEQLQATAKALKTGLWKKENPEAPWDWRKAQRKKNKKP